MNVDIFKAIAESSPHINFVYDPDKNTFIYTNPAFKSLLGLSSEVIEEGFILSLIPQEDVIYLNKSFQSLLQGTLDKDVEFRLNAPARGERWIRLTPFTIEHENTLFICGDGVDVTEELNNLHTQKKYANKKDSILNILAHDLLGPLGIARSISSILMEKIEAPKIKRLVDTIEKVNKQAIDLIRDLTEREFLESAEVVLVKQRINISQKLKEFILEYQENYSTSTRTFNFEATSDQIFIEVDEAKFIQILNNLFTNALKFTKHDGVITLKVEDQNDHVIFSVADNGIGIPEKYHATLFDKFTNARRKGLQGEPSVGLGMSIIKMIIEWHNGTVWFESEENVGTTVYFKLPKTSS